MLTRIKQVVEYSGLSVRAFAIKCGLNQPTLFYQLKGQRNISIETVSAIAIAYPEISCDWIVTGEGSMLKAATNDADRLSRLEASIDLLTKQVKELNGKISNNMK